jgi:hypothetical protein
VIEPDAPEDEIPADSGKDEGITLAEYTGLQTLYDWLNHDLFDGHLPQCVITLQRRGGSNAHYGPERFAERGDQRQRFAEINLNPDSMTGKSDEWIASALGHEMAHCRDHYLNGLASDGYHREAWAEIMKGIGLWPSSTDAVGGKETGKRVGHYIVPGGRFEQSFRRLEATGFKLRLESVVRSGAEDPLPGSRPKLVCQYCGQTAAKVTLKIACLPCLAGGLISAAERWGLSGEQRNELVETLDECTMRIPSRAEESGFPPRGGEPAREPELPFAAAAE